MAETPQPRRYAPRAEDTRSPIVTLLQFTERAEALFTDIDVFRMRSDNGNVGNRIEKAGHALANDLEVQALIAVPRNRVDTALLAAHAAIMAEQLDALLADDESHNSRLVSGLQQALDAIADQLLTETGLASADVSDLVGRHFARATNTLRSVVQARRDSAEPIGAGEGVARAAA